MYLQVCYRCFILQQLGWVVVTETLWPRKAQQMYDLTLFEKCLQATTLIR